MTGAVEAKSTLSVSGASTYGGVVQVNNVINATGNINTTSDINSKRVYSGYIQSTGRITSDEYVQINGIAVSGAACSPNGLIGRSSAGDMLSCQSGVWGSGGKVEVIYGNNPVCSANKIP